MPVLRTSLVSLAALGLVATEIAGAAAAGYSPTFSVTGDVGAPGTTFDYSSLSALGATDLTTAGYIGTSLWSVLQASGGVNPIPGVPKNSILLNYVVAIGSDGYEVAYSGGQISPNFANNTARPGANPPYVAYALYPGGAPLDTSGMARTITQGDVSKGAWNQNIVEFHVGTAPLPAAPPGGWPGGYSTSFTVSGVQNPQTFTFSTLKQLAQANNQVTTVTDATYLQGGNPVTDTYTGITLYNLLNDLGLIVDNTIQKNDILRQYVEVVGSDGYAAIFSLSEIAPNFGNADDIVAWADTSGQLGDDPATNFDGFARMVAPGDLYGGRYISNIAEIEVFTAAVPEPSTWAMAAIGFAILAGAHARSRARAAANT